MEFSLGLLFWWSLLWILQIIDVSDSARAGGSSRSTGSGAVASSAGFVGGVDTSSPPFIGGMVLFGLILLAVAIFLVIMMCKIWSCCCFKHKTIEPIIYDKKSDMTSNKSCSIHHDSPPQSPPKSPTPSASPSEKQTLKNGPTVKTILPLVLIDPPDSKPHTGTLFPEPSSDSPPLSPPHSPPPYELMYPSPRSEVDPFDQPSDLFEDDADSTSSYTSTEEEV